VAGRAHRRGKASTPLTDWPICASAGQLQADVIGHYICGRHTAGQLAGGGRLNEV